MLKRMKQKVDTQEQEAEAYVSDSKTHEIDNAIFNIKVHEALNGLKKHLGL